MENINEIDFKKYCFMYWSEAIKDVPLSYMNNSINNLQGELYKPIIEKCKNWDFKTPLVMSVISVQNGIGKSHIASSMLKLFISNYVKNNFEKIDSDFKTSEYYEVRKFKLAFVPERIIYREIRDSYKDKYKTESNIFEKYSRYDCLIIDDIFSNKETGDKDFSRRTILDIVNDRCEYTMKPTILTSNLSFNEFVNIDTRIASRINNSMLIEINSKLKDHRTVAERKAE